MLIEEKSETAWGKIRKYNFTNTLFVQQKNQIKTITINKEEVFKKI